MAKSTNHQCPACTGPLRFDAKTNLLVCDYCDSKFSVEEIDKLYGEKINASVKEGMNTEGNRFNAQANNTTVFKTYSCSSCGAQLFCEEETVATSCPYCGNPNVIAGKFHDGEMPDLVIPFKIEKKEAVECLSKFYKGKKLLPKVFSEQNHIEEVKGVYVPFWLFDGAAGVSVQATGKKTSVRTTNNERIETTSHYRIERNGIVPFANVPIDASKKMDNSMMDSLEPFDYDAIKKFSSSYLPGFFAEIYDDSAADCQNRMEKRVSNTAIQEMMSDITGYESISVTSENVSFKIKDKAKYALFPVWLLSTKWKDKNFLFAINGQTGKMVGNLPIDYGKFWKWIFGITFVGTAILTPLIYFFLM